MTGHPFSITAPAVIIMPAGASGTFKVTDAGTRALTVHQSLGRYNLKALHYPAASHATLTTFSQPWITVSPASFTLKPGQSETVHIADHMPASVQGNHYLSIVWTGTPAGAAPGTLHLAGGVATSVEIPLPGAAVPVTSQGLPHAPPGPVATGGGPSALAISGAILLAMAVALAVVLIVTRRHRARSA